MENVVNAKKSKMNKDLIEIVSSYKSCNVIDGGSVFISIDDARSILRNINRVYKSQDEHINMLNDCADMLKVISERILFSGFDDSEESVRSLTEKYL